MAILSVVEARTWRGRLIRAGVVIALVLAGIAAAYPFVVMVAGSMRSGVDAGENSLLPAFLSDEEVLYRRFVEAKYDGEPLRLNRTHLSNVFSFAQVNLPAADPEAAAAGEAFLGDDEFPLHWMTLGAAYAPREAPKYQRELRNRLREEYETLPALSTALGATATSWAEVRLRPPDWMEQGFAAPDGPVWEAYVDLLRGSHPAERVPVSLTGYFLETMVVPTYGRSDVAAFNAATGLDLDHYGQFDLPASPPQQPTLRSLWVSFARDVLHPGFVRVAGASDAEYQSFLDDPDAKLPGERERPAGANRLAFASFIDSVPDDRLRLVGPDFAIEREHGVALHEAVPALERRYVLEKAGTIRGGYVWQNYAAVLSELLLEGRALFNTAVFCTLSVLASLLLNPLAAYALSRFQPLWSYKALLLLMGTIAFPPMVTMIPQFVLLRHAGLLNTFVALVLPLAVNGYMIFLLKGFFDSLPRELYEAADIDGAGEMRMFFQLTLSLSKPILAVLALGTFTSAYTQFLYPLLVAPDQDMWLLSVWLYQFQQRSSSGLVYASIVIASVPTLLIFLFTQRTIMRGIVVPTEK
jgi:multiple sugar transport system permease protein